MVARDMEDLSGQQVGNYEIVSHLVARPASDLFLARDVELERLVFLEVLRVTTDEDPELAESFRRRMQLVAQLKDPHVADVSDVDATDDGYVYAVLEYFPGLTLADRVNDLWSEGHSLPVIDSLELAKEIAQGLAVAHSAGLVHHDLRPENIFLRQDGRPVLIDLGVPPAPLAEYKVSPAEAESDVLDYAAPEVQEGKALTLRSNIYSLGIILYELLAGHRPRLPNLPFDIFPQANVPKEEPLEEARPGLAGETYRLVRNCLWRQEWSRFETPEEMITAVETAIFAEQELPKASAWRPRRERSLVILLPVAILLLGALAFLLFRGFAGGNAEAAEPTPNVESTPATLVAVGTTPTIGETAEPTNTATVSLPTESASDNFTISVLSPGPNREFSVGETINFDWFWPTLPRDGQHFAVYLIDNGTEYLLGTLTEPNNGAAYRLQISGDSLPVTGDNLAWQVRLEDIEGGVVQVASDPIPLVIRPLLPSATPTPSETPTVEATPCVVSPPPGWVQYVVRAGDAVAALAARANLPVESLLQVNCLVDDLLSVGQELWVPAAAVPRTPTAVFVPTDTPRPSNPQPTSPPLLPSPTTGGGGGSTSEPPTNTRPPDPPTPTEPPPPTEAPTQTIPRPP